MSDRAVGGVKLPAVSVATATEKLLPLVAVIGVEPSQETETLKPLYEPCSA